MAQGGLLAFIGRCGREVSTWNGVQEGIMTLGFIDGV